MTTVTIELSCKPFPAQSDLIMSKARFNVVAAGRRWGKTEAGKIRATFRAPRMRVWWIEPTFDIGQHIWRYFAGAFEVYPQAYINHSERLILFGKDKFIAVKSADSTLRGIGLDHVIIDEAAFCPPDLWPEVIRPMLLESKGSADFLSSTNGRNWFWQLYQLGLLDSEPDWCSWHFTSYDNPLLDRQELEDIKRNTPQRVFEQEYMAAFLEDGGAVFRNIQACIMQQPQSQPVGRVVLGVDWGKVDDFTAVTAIDTKTRNVLEIDHYNQIDWTLQRGRIVAMANKWGARHIFAEANSIGEPNIEELHKVHKLTVRPFQTTNASKQQIINSLAMAFEQGAIGIPDNPTLLGELQAFTVERLPGGSFRYAAPAGMHDDCVISLALAWYGVLNPPEARVVSYPDIFGHDLDNAMFGHDL